MAQLSKKRKVSIKLTPGKQKQVVSAIDLLASTYGELLSIWSQLTSEQQDKVLAASPLLAKCIALFTIEVKHGA
jgi:hypothetical protein